MESSYFHARFAKLTQKAKNLFDSPKMTETGRFHAFGSP
jgi:hypothetical protein